MRTRTRMKTIVWLCAFAVLGCSSSTTGTSKQHAGASSAGSGAATANKDTLTTQAGNGTGGAAGGAGATSKDAAVAQGVATLFYLNNAGQVLRANADGTARMVIVQSQGVGPDGVAVDVAAGHVYWTNMGQASVNDGTILRADLDGKNVTTIVPAGGAFTPKQLKLDAKNGKLYFSDREGMRVMRANLDGSSIETLVTTGSSDADRQDASRWCVGIAFDLDGGKLYWTQKGSDNAGKGSIRRANIEIPAGQDSTNRSDIEVLFKNLPEPIDLDLDLDKQLIYWTDRGDNTVSRAPMDPPAGFDPAARSDREMLVHGLGEGIGISLDLPRGRMFYTSLTTGVVGTAAIDGSGARDLLTGQGLLTGIELVDLPQ